jgi:hypothetical protein
MDAEARHQQEHLGKTAKAFAQTAALTDQQQEPEPKRDGAPRKKRPGVGMPSTLLLDEFGALLSDAFGAVPYHVGSSLVGTGQWRDVDVRVMLPDERYESEGYGDPLHPHQNAKWVAMVRAFSLLGQQMTGLPIDFQIQQTTDANTRDPHERSALGIHTYFRRNPRRHPDVG